MAGCRFYDIGPEGRERRLFEIVEGAWAEGKRVVVYSESSARAAEIDRSLWTHRQESFMPHRVFVAADPGAAERVGIVASELNPMGATVLVADGHCTLDFALQFEEIAEFVDRSSPERHKACRERYQAYQARQIPLRYLK